MTDTDIIEVARYQGSTEEEAERAVTNFRYALEDLEQIVQSREGLKAIREEIDGWQDRIARLVEMSKPFREAAQ